MASKNIAPTDNEIFFSEDQIIVSKTDLKGKITYANSLFEKVSGYGWEELSGQPHSLIRHPDMPRCVFKLLWDTLDQEKEIFAYVKNMAKNGDYYWVLAHVVSSYDITGKLVGYHSSRRSPKKHVVQQISPLYKGLLEIEKNHQNPKDGLQASLDHLINLLDNNNVSYAEYITALSVAA